MTESMQDGVVKGTQCLDDSAASEFLQRTLRVGWGRSYNDRYALLRKRKDTYRNLVLNIRMNPEKRGRKRISSALNYLQKNNYKDDRTKRRIIYRPMTFPAFEQWKTSLEGGEHSLAKAWPYA